MQDSRCIDATDFIQKISGAIRSGFGIIPLFGSGMSSPSGIIMGMEFSSYLAYAVDRALTDGWDFRSNNWPPFPDPKQYEQSRSWVHSSFKAICERNGYDLSYDPQGLVKAVFPDVRRGHQSNSLADLLNCPPCPAAIRSPYFESHHRELARFRDLLRSSYKTLPQYGPLWRRSEDSPTSRGYLEEHALCSLADWRTTLDFVSRIKQVPYNKLPELGESDPRVIDRFNTFITSGAQPTLGHKMLVHLMRPLRIRTVLTTNFDTLIEDAATQSDMPLKKFLVSTRGELPDAFSVKSQPAIIKLHGELLETRSDLSLDDEPSNVDLQNFYHYFFDPEPSDGESVQLRSVPSHLLVSGFSASDLRIIRFIQHLLDRTRDVPDGIKPTVFWIGVTNWDVQQIGRLLPASEYRNRLWIHQTARPDLLLHEMYQRMTLSLPGGGMTYEYSHNVPPNRYGAQRFNVESTEILDCITRTIRGPATPDAKRKARDELARIVGTAIVARTYHTPSGRGEEVGNLYFIQKGSDFTVDSDGSSATPFEVKGERAQEIVLVDAPFGMLEALNIPHAQLSSKAGHNCLWFELADYFNADSLLRDILRAMSLRMGRFQREQVTLHPLDEELTQNATLLESLSKFLTDLCRVYRMSASHWTIFVYGREAAGSCTGWIGSTWKPDDWKNLEALLRTFAEVGFRIVFAIPTRAKYERERAKRSAALTKLEADIPRKVPDEKKLNEYYDFLAATDALAEAAEINIPEYETGTLDGKGISLFREMVRFLDDKRQADKAFENFFYAATLFRQSRRPSALFYEGVQPCPHRFNLVGIDNDLVRSKLAATWTAELEQQCVFYYKAGGHSWMHRDLRLAMRHRLDRSVREDAGGLVRYPGQDAARTHFFIGDWYFKAFCSTGFTLPIIESLHHRFQAGILSPFAVPKNFVPGTRSGSAHNLTAYRYSLLRSSILEITKTLIVTRPYLKLWLANEHGFPMFNDGGSIHNSHRSTNLAGLKTLKAELQKAATRILSTSSGMPVKPAMNPFREEIDLQLGALEFQIRLTDRAIREEASISRSTFSTCCPTSFVSCFEEDLTALSKSVYDTEWRDVAYVAHVIKKIVVNNDNAKRIQELADFKYWKDNEFDVDLYAQEKALCLAGLSPKYESLLPLLELFQELAYARMRRAKFLQHSHQDDSDLASRDIEVRKSWLKVAQLCNLGIDWCRHLPAECLSSEMQIKVRLHSYYAVALANLDRFYEAHRHLDEASGLNSKREVSRSRIEIAKLRLRRAEVFLTEAHRLRSVLARVQEWQSGLSKRAFPREALRDVWHLDPAPGCPAPGDQVAKVCIHPSVLPIMPAMPIEKGDTKFQLDLARILTATLDDAWVQLDYAEQALAGLSQSNLWWGRLASMKLRAFGYQVCNNDFDLHIQMLAYRHRKANPQSLWSVFESAFLNNRNCLYRQLRLIRYMADALKVCRHFGDGRACVDGMWTELSQMFASLKARVKKSSKRLQVMAKKTDRVLGFR